MEIAIIGGGAIGLLSSCYLRDLGHKVHILTRTEKQATVINKEGINLQRSNVKYHYKMSANSVRNIKKVKADLWVNTLKQWNLAEFLNFWGNRSGRMLFLQNGMGHMELAGETNPNLILYAGVVTHGAMKIDHVTVNHTGLGNLLVGQWGSRDASLAYLIDPENTYFPIDQASNIHYVMRRKLLINMVINPLTCLYRIKNGELLENEYFIHNMKSLFLEGIKALQLQETEWENLIEVIQQTSKNESSMLRDRKEKRPTEINAITGYALSKGAEKGLSMPVTSFVHHSVLGLERRGWLE